MTDWHETVDFVVVGSGAAGLSGAVTAAKNGLKTLVLEKSDKYGGTSALSGGVVWIANNPVAKAAGINDSEALARQYLQQVVSDDVDEQKLEAYIHHGAKMLEFMSRETSVKFDLAKDYPDYYAELEGGLFSGRSLDPKPFSASIIGDDVLAKMFKKHAPGEQPFSITAREAHEIFSFSWRSNLVLFKRMFLYALDLPRRLKGLPDRRVTLGRALVARLMYSAQQVGVELRTQAAVVDIICDGMSVQGVLVQQHGAIKAIRARKGVLLAAGGFSRDEQRRQQHQQAPIGAQWTATNPHDTGDAIRLAEKIGAQLEMLGNAWWTPTMTMPSGGVEAFIVGKSMPGCVVVNKAGQRFCNEAEPYEDFVKHQYQSNEKVPSIPAYLVFDGRYRREYPVGTILAPGKFKPDSRYQKFLKAGWLKKADSLDALAKLIGVDSEGLQATAAKMTHFAKTGIDEDFHRGESANDRYYSDHRVSPNPCLGALAQPPFYAIEIWPGDLGTKGGVKTDAKARALDTQGQVIPGLYAAGNSQASVMGNSYPGAGSTLGPAMTFAYLAALDAANKELDHA